MHYFTGRPCKHGHVVKRYANSGECTECGRIKCNRAAWYQQSEANAEKVRARARAWHAANPEQSKLNSAITYLRNKDRAKAQAKAWRRANPRKNCAGVMMRYARKMSRLPAWADKRAIRRFYKDRPEGMAVDHIFPIAGLAVCGLHIVTNMQYLTPKANRSKSNSFTPQWPYPGFDVDVERACVGIARTWPPL